MHSPDDSDDIATCLSNEVIQWIDPLNNRKIYHVWTHPDGIKHLKIKSLRKMLKERLVVGSIKPILSLNLKPNGHMQIPNIASKDQLPQVLKTVLGTKE